MVRMHIERFERAVLGRGNGSGLAPQLLSQQGLWSVVSQTGFCLSTCELHNHGQVTRSSLSYSNGSNASTSAQGLGIIK